MRVGILRNEQVEGAVEPLVVPDNGQEATMLEDVMVLMPKDLSGVAQGRGSMKISYGRGIGTPAMIITLIITPDKTLNQHTSSPERKATDHPQ